MGLFDKKTCDFCGEKIGLLGNKKLEDGNMCKDCASKLSPWFNERRHSTRAEIQEQLDYREENRKAVADFHVSRSLGRYTKLLLDEDAKKFTVTSSSNLEKANPDILDFDQVTDCRLDIDESRYELKQKDAEGKLVSYDPPRYEYSYDFHTEIDVNHPFFDKIRFSLSNGYVKTGDRPNAAVPGNWQINPAEGMNLRMKDYYEYVNLGNQIKATVDAMRFGGIPCVDAVPDFSSPVTAEPEVPAEPREPVVCPWCGLTTFPDAQGRCEFCTGTLSIDE